MSILTILQNASLEIGLQSPSSVITSTDETTRQLLALLKRAVRDCAARAQWPRLTREYTFTLTAGQENYAFPADYDRAIFRTNWNRNRKWELIGPISAQEWQFRKSGIVATTPRQYFRVKGWENEKFFIFPTPDASVAGQTIAFEYQSTTAMVPQNWTASTVFNAGAYCSYDANVYTTAAGGTSGSTAPTHTSGSASDGGVTWTYVSTPYPGYLSDSDYCLIDEEVITLSVQWRFLQQKGLDYEKVEAEYEKALMREISAEIGAKTLSLNKAPSPQFISGFNVPDSGFGN